MTPILACAALTLLICASIGLSILRVADVARHHSTYPKSFRSPCVSNTATASNGHLAKSRGRKTA